MLPSEREKRSRCCRQREKPTLESEKETDVGVREGSGRRSQRRKPTSESEKEADVRVGERRQRRCQREKKQAKKIFMKETNAFVKEPKKPSSRDPRPWPKNSILK